MNSSESMQQRCYHRM